MENPKEINEEELSFPKGNPFDVPENYFNEFPVRIANLIEQNDSPKIISISPFRKAFVFIAYAAIVVVVCSIGFTFLIPNNPELTADDISEYMNQQGIIDELAIDEIVGYSSSKAIDTINIHSSVNLEEVNTIEAMLLEEDVDLIELINTL